MAQLPPPHIYTGEMPPPPYPEEMAPYSQFQTIACPSGWMDGREPFIIILLSFFFSFYIVYNITFSEGYGANIF